MISLEQLGPSSFLMFNALTHRIIMYAGSSSLRNICLHFFLSGVLYELIVISVGDFVVTLSGDDNQKLFFCVEQTFEKIQTYRHCLRNFLRIDEVFSILPLLSLGIFTYLRIYHPMQFPQMF